VILEIHKGAVFFVCSLCKCIYPISDEKEGAGNLDHSRYKNGTRLWKVRVKKQITIIVDVDDKNFLAQLTVAVQLNQGVRQRLYIVAGVLFFRSFFCTSKRKNIKKEEKLVVPLRIKNQGLKSKAALNAFTYFQRWLSLIL